MASRAERAWSLPSDGGSMELVLSGKRTGFRKGCLDSPFWDRNRSSSSSLGVVGTPSGRVSLNFNTTSEGTRTHLRPRWMRGHPRRQPGRAGLRRPGQCLAFLRLEDQRGEAFQHGW